MERLVGINEAASMALFGRQPGCEFCVGHESRVHGHEFASSALLEQNDGCPGLLADSIDFYNGLHMFEHRNPFFERGSDNNLQTEIFVEAHHLPLVLSVHLRKRLIEDRDCHARRVAGATLRRAVDRRQ